jgi:hypothetical protein
MTGLTPLVRELEARLNATPRRGTQLLLTLPLGPFDEGLHFPKLPNASTKNATMTTQNANAYVLTYSIGVNALTMASTATSTESTNIHIDGGLWQVTTPSALRLFVLEQQVSDRPSP